MLKRSVLGVGCSLLLAASPAGAVSHGWYWGIEAGVDMPKNVDVTCALCLPSTTSFDDGFAGLTSLGIYVGPNIRVELEAGYRGNRQSNDVDVSDITVMANALYDIWLMDDFKVSLGGGLGVDRFHQDFIGDSDTTFAYQFIGGASWVLSPHMEVFAQYRYLSASGPTLNNGLFDIEFDDLQRQTVTAGVRFGLN